MRTQLLQLVLDHPHVRSVLLNVRLHLLATGVYESFDLPHAQTLKLVHNVLKIVHFLIMLIYFRVKLENLLNDFWVQFCVAQYLLHTIDYFFCLGSYWKVRQILSLQGRQLVAC